MKRLLLLAVLCFCSCSESPVNKDTITVPALHRSGEITYRYDELTPLLWAYCLDIVKGTAQEPIAWEQFNNACDKDKLLLGKVGHYYAIHRTIQEAQRHRRFR